MVSIDKRILQHTEEVTAQIIVSKVQILGQITELRHQLTEVQQKVSTLKDRMSAIEKDLIEFQAFKMRSKKK